MTVDQREAQAAVREMSARVGALVRSVRRPDARGVGDWSVVELACHLSHAMDAVSATARGAGGFIEDIAGLAGLTATMVASESERDPLKLGDRIEASVAAAMDWMGPAADAGLQTWFLPGVKVPISFLTCHILNELTVHGHDIAKAEGVAWPISKTTARLVLEGFVVPVLTHIGDQLVHEENARGVRVAYRLHLRGGGSSTWRFQDGKLTVTQGPSNEPVDCHISADPVAFLLVTWGRLNQWRAIGRGQLLAWGRKPWMGLKLRSLVRNP
ncbi:MAG TPA: maleylpyruvate isomerase N-terminal domain-containing protein [Acidimicrobiales bacterium]|nr:maleylpyruvate isomerase N-terminal domain-containing protein [Acidimicrobiales bacterium]